ncbi:MAG: hypothetical protein HQK98_08715 [Nitrospirae bacterium]|nr:hypothetical protein [Nitrospirota bacterium]
MKGLKVMALLMAVLAGVLILNTKAQAGIVPGTYCWQADAHNGSGVLGYHRLSIKDFGNGHYSVVGTITAPQTNGTVSVKLVNGAMELTDANTLEMGVSVTDAEYNTALGANALTVVDFHYLLNPVTMSGPYYTSSNHNSVTTTKSYGGVATLTTCTY